jgi:hypothetical protein
MSEYDDLMYRLAVAQSQLTLASNQVMGDRSAMRVIDEAIHAIDTAVAIIGRQSLDRQQPRSKKAADLA